VAPLAFLVATRRSLVRSRLAIRIALAINDRFARARDGAVEVSLQLPAGRLVSRAVCLRLFPGVDPAGLTGGAMWYDYQMPDADRLTFAFARAAHDRGAVIANHVEALAPLRRQSRIAGVSARDGLTGAPLEIRAALTINATGGRAGEWMQAFGVPRPFPLLKALNLVTSRPTGDIGLAAPTRAGRLLTLVPWRGRALIGTGQSSSPCGPDDAAVSAAELDAFVGEVNEAFRHLALRPDEVTLVHRGLVPAVVQRGREAALKTTPEIIDHAGEGAPGALTIVGVKYSSARRLAEKAIERAGARLGRRLPRSRTRLVTLPGAEIADYEAIAREAARQCRVRVDDGAMRQLIAAYGSDVAAVIPLLIADSTLAAPLAPTTAILAAQIVHAVRAELACTLVDAVVRRTGLGAGGHPGDEAAHAAGVLMARELGWNPGRLDLELDQLRQFYAPVAV
jgi:glycerol-3-phosphate dehydrogenase